MRSGSNANPQSRLSHVIMAWAVIALGVIGVKSVSAQCMYEVTVVTGPPCPPLSSRSVHLFGLNDYGQACGEIAVCEANGQPRPIVWTKELGIVLLPLPDGATYGEANDINNVLGSDGFGQVACTLAFPSLGSQLPYLYDDGTWTSLDLLPGAQIGEAWAINDAGDVVGGMSSPGGGINGAFLWHQGRLTAIDLPIGPFGYALDINESSAIVGLMGQGISGFALGFLQQDGVIEEIPPVSGGMSSEARGVNSDAVVTGQSLIPVKEGSIPRRSWMYKNGKLTDLGGFADTHRNIADDINDAGQIIGLCYTVNNVGTEYLWQDDNLINLREFFDVPPGLGGLSRVTAVNNHGQIAGWSGGTSRGMILTPTNRPLGDLNVDCEVDGTDLAMILSDWGPCSDGASCLCDIVSGATFQPPGDGVIDGADLAVVLDNWTKQPQTQQPRR